MTLLYNFKMLVKTWRNFKTELKNISQVTNFLITINHYMFKRQFNRIFNEINTSYFV